GAAVRVPCATPPPPFPPLWLLRGPSAPPAAGPPEGRRRRLLPVALQRGRCRTPRPAASGSYGAYPASRFEPKRSRFHGVTDLGGSNFQVLTLQSPKKSRRGIAGAFEDEKLVRHVIRDAPGVPLNPRGF